MPASISIFVSYAQQDDIATHGRISNFRADIANTYEALTGEPVEVFQDVESIGVGEQWKDRIRAGLSSSSVLLAFISPAFLRSASCREELRDFLGFLAGRSTHALLVPLVFADVKFIDEDDDLWMEVRRLQCLHVSDLRVADRGTERWQRTVEKVANRIFDVLGTAASDQASAGPSGPAPQPSERPDVQRRAATILAEWKSQAPRIAASLHEYNEFVARISDQLRDSAALAGAPTFAQRMTVARQLASGLDPFVEAARGISARLRADVLSLDEDVRWVFRQIRRGAVALSSPTVVEFRESVRSVAELGTASLQSAGETIDALEQLRGRTQHVDVLLVAIRDSFLIFTELRGSFRGWIEELHIVDEL